MTFVAITVIVGVAVFCLVVAAVVALLYRRYYVSFVAL